jgi:hypothetical protein
MEYSSGCVHAALDIEASKPLRALTRRARNQAKDAVVIAKGAW